MSKDIGLREYYQRTNPIPFYVILSLFVFSNMLLVINFKGKLSEKIVDARVGINALILILCVLYICINLLLWDINAATLLISVSLITLVGFGWNLIGQTNEFFCTVVAALLAILSCQRDFRMILKIVLFSHIGTVVIGALGLLIGFTELAYKRMTTDNGFSMGLVYPNHLGRMLFLILMIIWYLRGQKRKWLTLIIFWTTGAFVWFVVKCRTVSFFMVSFPACWVLITLFRSYRIRECRILRKSWEGTLIAFPFLCMIFTYAMGRFRAFFATHWHFGQGIYALWMRFISAGMLFDKFGFPLLGRNIREEFAPIEYFNGKEYVADIVDNAYIFYLVAIGGIALVACMLWLSFGAYRAVKNQDWAFLLMFIFLCGYGLIEVVFFQFEHNFLFFYPLTANAMAYKMFT